MFRIDKDKGQILHEVSDVRAATDEVNRSRVSHQKMSKLVINTWSDFASSSL